MRNRVRACSRVHNDARALRAGRARLGSARAMQVSCQPVDCILPVLGLFALVHICAVRVHKEFTFPGTILATRVVYYHGSPRADITAPSRGVLTRVRVNRACTRASQSRAV
jgi:hypothetical protein